MAVLYGRAGCLTARNDGFRPGQGSASAGGSPTPAGTSAPSTLFMPMCAPTCRGTWRVSHPAAAALTAGGAAQDPKRAKADRLVWHDGATSHGR